MFQVHIIRTHRRLTKEVPGNRVCGWEIDAQTGGFESETLDCYICSVVRSVHKLGRRNPLHNATQRRTLSTEKSLTSILKLKPEDVYIL